MFEVKLSPSFSTPHVQLIVEATRVPDEEENQSPVVYNAVQVERKSWYKQKRVYIALGSALIGAALAIGFTQGRDTNNNNSELVTTDEESDTELVTVPSSSPSQSFSPTSTLHFKPYGSSHIFINRWSFASCISRSIGWHRTGVCRSIHVG